MFRFKPLVEEDLILLYQWFQVPHIKKWYARGQHFSFDMIKEKYLPRINHPEIHNFIVYFDDRPIGYIQCYHLNTFLPEGVTDHQHPLFRQYSPDRLVGIDLFVADENVLSKGYGSLMLTQFIEEYVKGQFEAVVVDPKKDNIVAIQFFRKNGFICLPVDECSQHALMMLNMKGDE